MDIGKKNKRKLLLANNLADWWTQLSYLLDYNHYHRIRAAHYDILCTEHCKGEHHYASLPFCAVRLLTK